MPTVKVYPDGVVGGLPPAWLSHTYYYNISEHEPPKVVKKHPTSARSSSYAGVFSGFGFAVADLVPKD